MNSASQILENRRARLRAPFLVDAALVVLALLLVGIGLVMVYSTTGIVSQERFGDPLYYTKRQLTAALAGFVVMLILSRFSPQLLKKISPYCYGLCLFLLCLTLIPGIGDSAGGARRWIQLPGLRIQPGEFVKVLFIVFIAGYWARHEAAITTFWTGMAKPFLLAGLVAGLYLAQPDFGSAAVVLGLTLAMSICAGVKFRYVVGVGLVLASALGALILVSPYRLQRILTFLSPWSDSSGKGYQLIQSLIAVGTGNLSGVGLGAGQQKLFFLPAAHTDFIFAVISEELGFIGAVVLLAVFLLFMWRGFTVAMKVSGDTFSFILAVGLTLVIVLPALLNMGVVLGLLPTKGLVLPFVGYGGSSLLASLGAVGILLALARSFYSRPVR